MAIRVRDTESVKIRLPKSLLARVRVFAEATRRSFSFACDKLLTDAVDSWEREGKMKQEPEFTMTCKNGHTTELRGGGCPECGASTTSDGRR